MRYDAAERLKIDYESLKAIKPDLIYCHTRGFERGVRAGLPGNDQTGACLSGIQFEDGGMGRSESGVDGRPLWSFTSFGDTRSEEHTSELQSLMRISYAVFCLKKKKQN